NLSAILCHSHIELRGALRDRAVLAQPGKPLAVRHLSPALDKQFAGRDGVLEAILECVGDGGVLGPDARCQLGQVVRFGERGFHHPFRFPKARGRRRTSTAARLIRPYLRCGARAIPKCTHMRLFVPLWSKRKNWPNWIARHESKTPPKLRLWPS